MVQTLKAQNIDLRYLIEHFGLQRVRDDQFFWEWQADLPEITDIEKQELDRVQERYFNWVESISGLISVDRSKRDGVKPRSC